MASEGSSGRRAIDLPSFNLSNYINIGEGQTAKDLLEQLKNKGTIVPVKNERPQGQPMTNGTSKGKGIRQVARQKSAGLNSKLATQIMEGPKLSIKVPNEYSRFRYESEKTKDKKRKRNYDTDDTEKQCLLEIEITDYNGTAKVICYCCDENGNIHPFSLFGDRGCHYGVYVSREKFKPQKKHRLTGVSVVMPTKGDKEKIFMKEKLQYLQNELKLDVKRRGDDDKHDKQLVHVMVVVQLEDEGKPPLYGISTALNNRKQGKEFLIDDVEPNMVMASGSPPNNQSKNRILVVVSNQTYFPNEPEVVLREKDASGKTRWEVVLSGEQLEIVKKAVVKFTAPPYLDRDIESDVQVELCLRDKKTNKETKPWPFFYLGSDLYDVRRKAKKRKLTDDDHSGTPTEYSEESKEFKRKAVSVYNGQYQEGAYRSYDTNGESSSSSETQNVLVIGKELSSPALTSLPFSTYKPMSPQPETQSYQELLGVTPSSSMLARPPSAGFNTADNAQTIIITSGAESNTYQVLNSQHDKYPVQAMDDQQGQTVVSSEADNTFTFPPLQPNQQLAIINGQWVIINNDLGEEMPGPSAGPSQPVPAPSLPEHHFQKPMSAPLNHPGRSESQSTRSSAPLLSTEQSTTPSMNMLLSSGLQALLNALTAQQPQQLQQPLQQQPQQTQAPAQQPTQQQPQTPVQQPIQQQQQQPAFFTPEQTQAFLQNLLTMYQTQLAQSSAGTPGNVASMAQSQSNEGSVMSDSDLETDGAHSQNNGLQSRTRSGKTIQAAGKPVPATRVTRGKKMYENMSGFSKPAGS